ncbi:MAG TPA: hypothetical protein VF021_07645 [Longimicrobiales bacterium]
MLAFAPRPAASQDSTLYSTVRLDSTQIRRVPLSRSIELPSYLPGAINGASYESRLRGALLGEDVRVDGVPVRNYTAGTTLLALPAFALESLTAIKEAGASYSDPVTLSYRVASAGTGWHGYARAASDAGLPGSIGNALGEVGVGGAPMPSLRIALNGSAQAARFTEFNNTGGALLFRPTGVDSTFDQVDINGNHFAVDVPGFEEMDADEVPSSNWNDLLGSLRVDFAPGTRTTLFLTGVYSQLQRLEALGGSCGCLLYDPDAWRGERTRSSLFILGGEHALGERSHLSFRVSRIADQYVSGVLDQTTAKKQTERSTGLDLSAFGFRVEPADYPVTDELITAIQNAGPQAQGFPPSDYLDYQLRTGNAYRRNPFGTNDFATYGVYSGRHTYSQESRWYGSGSWQTSLGAHSLSVGAEAIRFDTRFFAAEYMTNSNRHAWKEAPRLLSAFLADALHIGGVSGELGVRVDHYDPRTSYSRTPGYIVPDEMEKAAARTAVSPRLAVAVPLHHVTLRAAAGSAAHVLTFYDQFAGKNQDLFRFGSTNTDYVFSRRLDLAEQRYLHVGAEVQVRSNLLASLAVFGNDVSKETSMARVAFDDPTIPGSVKYLVVTGNRSERTASGVDAWARYGNDRSFARLGVTHESVDVPGSANDAVGRTSITALAAAATPRRLGAFDVTASVRALAPVRIVTFDPASGGPVESETPWIRRFDVRLARPLRVGGVHGSVWADGFRLAGSSVLFEPPASDQSNYVLRTRQQLGGGVVVDNLDLSSASPGRTEVERYMLQQAEKRFGNGDLTFSALEQQAAFEASYRTLMIGSTPLAMTRRMQLGVQLDF